MIKYLLLVVNLSAFMLYKAFAPDNISVTQSLPKTAKAGTEFTVEVTINKGSLVGFAKLQQELPEGLSASIIDGKGASFTFSNHTLKCIWTSLPSDNEFKISYLVKVDPSVAGDISLGGKFAYVLDNVKAVVEIPVSIINIEPIANAPEAVVPSPVPAAPEPAVKTESQKTSPVVSLTRNIPNEVDKEFTVEIVINKDDITGFAKLQETLPIGFTASGIDAMGASFTFIDQKVKFVWVSLPEEKQFKIAYKVTINQNLSGMQNIEGVFSYIENEETKKVILNPSSVNIKVSEVKAAPAVAKVIEEEKKTEKKVESSENTNEQTASGSKIKTPAPVTKIPSVQTGVNYRVQIAALHKTINTTYYQTKFNITEEVFSEMHEGWSKHTVGNFDKYKSARDHREEIKEKGIAGPFVCAYNTGTRITVQEALMITNQKWLK